MGRAPMMVLDVRAVKLPVFPEYAHAVENAGLRRAHFAREVLKRGIPEGIVRKKEFSQKRIREFELPKHVLIRVQAVVQKNINAAELRQEFGRISFASPQMHMPRLAQPLRHEPARLFSLGQIRWIGQADGMQLASLISVQG